MARSGLKNRLTNGAMTVDQRNSGAAVTLAAFNALTSASEWTVDRWFAWSGVSGTTQTAQRVSVMSGGAGYALRLARASGSTVTAASYVAQVMESAPNIDLQGQPVTLSFRARAGANFSGSGLTASISTGTGTDQGAAAFVQGTGSGGWTGFAVTANGTQALTTAWQTFVLNGTIPVGATQVGVLLGYTPSGTAGSADYADITDVQLEIGTFAAPQVTFERRHPGAELALCQRYYERNIFVSARGTVGAANLYIDAAVFFKSSKRVNPAIISSGNTVQYANLGTNAESAYSVTTEGFRYEIQAAAANTDTYVFNRNYYADAEMN